jgi:hypothetical protein
MVLASKKLSRIHMLRPTEINTTLFGSCRIDIPSNNLNNMISYVHTTKEILQLIAFINGEVRVTDEINRCLFRTGILTNGTVKPSKEFKKLFQKSNVVVIEICSRNLYKHQDYYLHLLAVNKKFQTYFDQTPESIKSNIQVIVQSDAEIEDDIRLIMAKLKGKRVYFVCHYDALVDGKPLPKRHDLICLIQKICAKNNYHFINPKELVPEFSQDEMQENFSHYSEGMKKVLFERITEIIKKDYRPSQWWLRWKG